LAIEIKGVFSLSSGLNHTIGSQIRGGERLPISTIFETFSHPI